MIRLSRLFRTAGCLAVLTLSAATDARAQGWQWTLTPYIWTTDVGVDISIKDQVIVKETIAFTDLIEDLDAAVQLRFEGQTGAHGFLTDLFWVGLSTDGSQFTLPDGGSATVDSKIRMTILDAAALYNPRGSQQGLTLFYGARIMVDRVELDATLAPPQGGSTTGSHETTDTLVDALVGARYTQRLSSHWSITGRADASTGGTEYTWSAGADVAYAFGERNRFAITGGYRHMAVEYRTERDSDITMTMSGFLGGFRFAF